MKVTIERKECTACGSCWDTCPKLFEENTDDSFSQIVEKFRINGNIAEGAPDKDLEECALDAADACPVEIIEIE